MEGMQPLDEETLRRITGLMVERRLTPEWIPLGVSPTADLLLPEG